MAPQHSQAHEAEFSASSRPHTRESSDDDSLPSDSTPHPPILRRHSSVRFSADTKPNSQSPMSSFRRRDGDSDEITPIRTANGSPSRSYNTTDPQNGQADGVPDEGEAETKPKSKWFKNIAEKYGAIELENKGSVARDHLALERTFLAWLRTSLAFASIGVAITQLFRLNTTIQSRQSATSILAIREDQVPFSPLVGQSLPPELIPYLQQALASASEAIPTLGPTLLDQLLLLPAPVSDSLQTTRGQQVSLQPFQFDENAAAKLRHVGKPLGATFLGIAIVILFIGFHRYFESQHWIIRGKFPASRGSIFIVGMLTGSLIVASLAVVLAVAPTSYEKKK